VLGRGVTDHSAATIAEAFSWSDAQPVTTQRCMCVCVCVCVCLYVGMYVDIQKHMCVCVVSSLCPVYFSPSATLRLQFTTLAIPSQSTRTDLEPVDSEAALPLANRWHQSLLL